MQVILLPFWILHFCSDLIGKFKFSEIDVKKYGDNPNDNDDEDDWLGRALDTERRVKKIVDNMRDEMKAEISATNAKIDATNAEISEMKTEISAANVKLDAILKALKIES